MTVLVCKVAELVTEVVLEVEVESPGCPAFCRAALEALEVGLRLLRLLARRRALAA